MRLQTDRALAAVLATVAALAASACATRAEVALDPTIEDAVRVAEANISVRPERVGPLHLLVDSPLVTAEFLAGHHYEANGTRLGDNAIVADAFYDAVHRRLIARSIQLGEVDDPVDIRLGRAEGVYPNQLDFGRSNDPDHVVGQIGGVRWTSGGFSAYTSAVSFVAGGALELSAQDPSTEDLVPRARVSAGGFEILQAGGNVPFDVVTRQQTWDGAETVARCEAGEIVLSGGGLCQAGALRASRPVEGGWQVICTEPGRANEVSLVCASQ